MALSSRLFRGNRALEACAVKDSAHVLLGATGDHVARIQFALFDLDGVEIDRTELVDQRYGRSTAAAVLAYKKKRKIINPSYQTAADDIVGKMTIASLDKEMRVQELRPKPPGECGISPTRGGDPSPLALAGTSRSAGSPAALQGGLTAAPEQFGGFIRVMFQITLRSAMEGGYPLSANIELARDLLGAHGITLFVELKEGFVDTLQFPDRVLVSPGESIDNADHLRKVSEDARPGLPGVLRVIVCPMVAPHGGETVRGRNLGGRPVPPFIILNSSVVDPSRASLIHEMIHVAKDKLPHDSEQASVFSVLKPKPGEVARTFLKPEHAKLLANLAKSKTI
jgi:hypothetical protein